MLKRTSPLFSLMAVMLLCSIPFLGCDKSTEPTDNDDNSTPTQSLIGTWDLVSVMLGALEIPAADVPIEMSMVVRSDLTFEATITMDDSTDTLSGTYTKTGTHVTMTYSDGSSQTSAYHFEGEYLFIEAVIPWDLDDDGVPEDVQVTLKYRKRS